MFVVEVCTSVCPSANSWSVGRPLEVSTMCVKDRQVLAAYRCSRWVSDSAGRVLEAAGGTTATTERAQATTARRARDVLRMGSSTRRRPGTNHPNLRRNGENRQALL